MCGRAGAYRIAAHASRKTVCEFGLFVNDEDISGPVSPSATGAVHTWNSYEDLGAAHLKAGLLVLTVKITKLPKGPVNLDYLDFIPR